ncbi:hypothetical protein BGX21_000948 [Mortierella sp. AD011]|nr:hypothetical protein BGX21_000948 [Mortierella sp. AD011]
MEEEEEEDGGETGREAGSVVVFVVLAVIVEEAWTMSGLVMAVVHATEDEPEDLLLWSCTDMGMEGKETRSGIEATEEAPSWIGKGVTEVVSDVLRRRLASRFLETEELLTE